MFCENPLLVPIRHTAPQCCAIPAQPAAEMNAEKREPPAIHSSAASIARSKNCAGSGFDTHVLSQGTGERWYPQAPQVPPSCQELVILPAQCPAALLPGARHFNRTQSKEETQAMCTSVTQIKLSPPILEEVSVFFYIWGNDLAHFGVASHPNFSHARVDSLSPSGCTCSLVAWLCDGNELSDCISSIWHTGDTSHALNTSQDLFSWMSLHGTAWFVLQQWNTSCATTEGGK